MYKSLLHSLIAQGWIGLNHGFEHLALNCPYLTGESQCFHITRRAFQNKPDLWLSQSNFVSQLLPTQSWRVYVKVSSSQITFIFGSRGRFLNTDYVSTAVKKQHFIHSGHHWASYKILTRMLIMSSKQTISLMQVHNSKIKEKVQVLSW